MKLFTSLCAALSAIAVLIYAAQAKWALMIWSASTLVFQVLYLMELWYQDHDLD